MPPHAGDTDRRELIAQMRIEAQPAVPGQSALQVTGVDPGAVTYLEALGV